ncbi:kinase-like domain-containing protein [Endogone sp. FLAS-F59071]|nr:kinase-like domain-containing protein [Endogone sp. FLAS-F59071]|eukprot:RUS22319.1 kinase-like domain-containing protein [Endogone sp. FLAS-F59071]
MENFQKVQRTFEEQVPPCRNCEANGKTCLAQLTPSKSDVCLECCNKGLETCIVTLYDFFDSDIFSDVDASPQLADEVVAAASDRRTLIPNDTDYLSSNPNTCGIIVSCSLCSKHSVMIRDFGPLKLCSDCISRSIQLEPLMDIPSGETEDYNLTAQALETSTRPPSDNVQSSGLQSSSLRSKLKCDRCSVKRIPCSHTFPCDKCNAEGAICSVSARRRRCPGTCGECVRRKIPCVGNGNVCYACELYKTADLCRPFTRSNSSNSTSDDNSSYNGPRKKRGREDTSNDNGSHGSMAATNDGNQNQRNVYVRLRKDIESLVPAGSIYSIKDCGIGEQIGRGGSMEVFKGTCNIDGTEIKVAFKRPHMEERDHRLLSVIKCELTIMELLKQNPNIVNLRGLTFDQSTPILIVELAKCSLDRYLSEARRRGQPISWTEKLRLCCNVCEGLLALHSENIVHGDIKAGNVLVFDKDDGTSTAKISDFGFSSTLSSLSNVGGTPAFAAPECTSLGLKTHPELLEWKRDKHQDVYSFGLFLWQVAMDGKGPYSGISRSDIEAAKTEDPELTKLMSQLLPDTPLALRKCIQEATKYMPLHRVSLNLLHEELTTLQRQLFFLNDPKLYKTIDQGSWLTVKLDILKGKKDAIKETLISTILEQAKVPMPIKSKAPSRFHKESVMPGVLVIDELASTLSHAGSVVPEKFECLLAHFQAVSNRLKDFLVQNKVNDNLSMTHVVADAEDKIGDDYPR